MEFHMLQAQACFRCVPDGGNQTCSGMGNEANSGRAVGSEEREKERGQMVSDARYKYLLEWSVTAGSNECHIHRIT